jgi:hypothetical protein
MRLPLLEQAGLLATTQFLSKNPPPPPSLNELRFWGQGPEPDTGALRTEILSAMEAWAGDPPGSDGLSAAAIHRCLRLTRREAAEMRFWHYLSLVKFPDYITWRYFDQQAGKTNKHRYVGYLDDNALSRLWWFAELTMNPANDDPYERTKRTSQSLEFVKGIVENLLGGNRPLVEAMSEVLFDGASRPPDALVKKMFIRTNAMLVSVAVDALSDHEVRHIIRQIHDSL